MKSKNPTILTTFVEHKSIFKMSITEKSEKKLFLLDAYALIFRAYYAFIKNPRYNSKGQNTSAILGFTNTLDEILKKEKPDAIAVVFDPPSPTFRKELYPEYKANRDETPEDIKSAVPYIKKIVKAFNIPVIEVAGFEADDTIGALAKQAEKEGFTTYMMTPDKDYKQLLSDNIYMYKPARSGNKAEVISQEDVCTQYGIESPKQFIDILALWGDTSDNIPGVKGIGEKTAAKLIKQFGSIEGIYENIDKLKGKQKENLINDREQLDRARMLVTIRLDVPVELNPEELAIKTPDFDKLKSLFNELEFNALSKRIIPQKQVGVQGSLFGDADIPDLPETALIPEHKFDTIKTVEHNYQLVDTLEAVKELAEKLSAQSEFCFDTETDALDAHTAKLVGISFSRKAHEAFYVPINAKNEVDFLSVLQPVLESEQILKIGQNIKYDILVLQNHNIKVKGKLFDTMLAHYLLQPEKRHNLNILSETFLNYQPVSIEELIGKKGKNQLSMRQVPLEKIKEYAGEDADLTYQLKIILKEKLKENELLDLAENIEFPLISVLADTERAGVKINKESLAEYEKELTQEIEQTEAEIYKAAGTHFNIASPKQLGIILFEKLKITDKPKLTKTKQYATGESELLKLQGSHEIIDHILNYRGLAKLLSTYVKALPELINKKTGKIHTSYNQAVAATGRLSSTNPNLQNIPIRTEAGRRIRAAFIPSGENNVLYAADYSQIELRIMAHLSQDKNMLQAFIDGEDIHTATAAKIFDVPISEVTKEMRSQAKSANFGIIYGISAFGLAQNLKISRSEAKKLIDGYFKSYPDVKKYMDESIRTGRETGVVKTIFGRKRYLLNINSKNAMVRGNDERNAINAPIQGSAADIIKIAMINVQKKLRENNLQTKMILQVHDELVFDVPKDELETVDKLVRTTMEDAAELSVKLIVDANHGNNWLEAH